MRQPEGVFRNQDQAAPSRKIAGMKSSFVQARNRGGIKFIINSPGF